jgi:Ca2+-binding RTX toxin-like protein
MLGGNGTDALVGGTGADLLVGNAGSDALTGGKGNDTLIGGKGDDTYFYQTADGRDTLLDSDGQGSIVYDGDALTGGAQYGDNRVYRSADKKHLYVLANDNTLLIDNQIVVQSYNKSRGDLGLSYSDAPTQSNPSTTRDIKGDLKPLNFGTDESPSYQTDPLTGNVITGAEVDPDKRDTLYDSAGNDHITSGGGIDDIYLAKGGDNWVEAGTGKDWVRGGVGKDLIEGGADSDILQGGAGDDRLYAGSQSTVAQAIADGNNQTGTGLQGDLLTGNAGDDIEMGSNANDALFGGAGNDLLIGGAGDDFVTGDVDGLPATRAWEVTFPSLGSYTLIGITTEAETRAVSGNDVIYLGNGKDLGRGGFGNDVIYGEAGDDTLAGGGDNDALFGGAGKDLIAGDYVNDLLANQADDYLDGGADDDTLYGVGGSDILIGGTGNDTLYGGEGQDIYIFNKGDGTDTVIDNKADNNIIRFGEGVLSSDITLRLGSLMLDIGNGDAIHIENFNRNDVYNSSVVSSFEFADGTALNTAELLARGFDLDGTAQDDEMWGTNITDRMRGFAGKDAMIGAGGDDSLQGGAGDDILFGDDVTTYNSSFSIAADTHGKDSLDGGDGNDQLVGGGNDDTLMGGAGNDKLYGDGDGLAAQYHGSDTLDGGDGDDELSGNGGNDVLLGGAGDDKLYGGDGNDRLDGGSGTNTLYGGAGDDTYIARVGDTINDTEGLNTLYLDGSKTDYKVKEAVGGLLLTTGNSVEGIFVQYGKQAGNTQLIFSDGTRTSLAVLAGSTLATQVNASSYENNVHVFGGLLADNLYSYAADNTLSGGAGDDNLTALGVRNTLNGGQGDDSLNVRRSNQTVQYSRGDGLDTLTGDWDWDTSGTVIALNGDFKPEDLKLQINQGQLSVLLGVNQSTGQMERMLLNMEVDRFTFTTDDVQTATLSYIDLLARGVQVLGTDGDDYLQGSGVNDEMLGGAGSNTLVGGAGADTYVIANGSASTVIDSTAAGEGVSVIRLAGVSSWADVVLTRPDAQSNDLLLTMPGNTTVTINSALLRAGQFSIELGSGPNSGQTRSLDSFLPGLPYLAVAGSYYADAIVGSDQGNALSGDGGDDVVTGGAGDDLLSGGDGNDVLSGQGGSDILFGGAGDDVFVINPSSGHDQVFDYEGTNVVRFASGITAAQLGFELLADTTDVRISVDANTSVLVYRALEGAVTRYEFTDGTQWSYGELVNRIAAAGAVVAGDDLNNTVNGSAGNDLILGNRGNDLLNGFAGDDVLQGGDGDDTLAGNTGNDVLNGGVGTDTYLLALGDGIDRLIDTSGASTIRFGAGIRLQDLSAEPVTVDGDAYIRLAYSNTDAVLIKEGVQLAGNAFVFADGTSLSQLQVYVAARHDARINPTYTEAADQIDGYASNDVLAGGGGDDRISGNAGVDVLDGGAGNDQLAGGDGNDTYVMSTNGGTDTVVETAGQHSTVQLGAGDQASLTYARAGSDLLLSNTALNTSFLISNFYGAPSTWTLKTAQGTELDLRALAVAGQAGKTADECREDFYNRLVAQAGAYNLGGQLFYGAGAREYTDAAGNEHAYAYTRERRLLQSNDALIEASAPASLSAYASVILNTTTTTTTREETVANYTYSTVQVTSGRNHSLGNLGASIDGFAAAGFGVPSGWYTYKNTVDNAWYAVEPATYATTLTTNYTTQTVTETQTTSTYRQTYDATSIIEDVRVGDGDNTVQLSGSSSKLVTGGAGNDLIERRGAAKNDSFDYRSGGPADWVDGGAGNDTIALGGGNDDISGGSGSDYLDGGSGGDTYVVDSSDDGWDTIYDNAKAVIHVELISSYYGYLDIDLTNRLRSLLTTITFDSRDGYVQGDGWENAPEWYWEGGEDQQYKLSGTLVVTAENINALLQIDRDRPLFDRTVYGQVFSRSSISSTGLDRLIATIPGPAYQRDGGGTSFGNAPPSDWPTGPLSPAITVTAEHLASSLAAVSDTIRFSSGIDAASLQIGWSVTESPDGTQDVMLISWGGQGGIKVVMPNADEPGVGIENFDFADGTHLTMAQMLALAPVRPGSENSVLAGAALASVVATEDAAFSYVLPVTAFAIGGYKTPRYSATVGDDGQVLPSWLHIDPLTGTLTGTPANGDVGNIVVKVTARQGPNEFASQMIALQVSNTNDAPQVIDYAYINEPTASADRLFSWALPVGLFTDQDLNDRLSLRVELANGDALPAWLKINFATGKLEGKPADGDAGVLAVRLVATDLAGVSANIPFSINVVPFSNHAPTPGPGITSQLLIENAPWQLSLADNAFTDADGDSLSYVVTLANGNALPSWMSFNAANLSFSGTPTTADIGNLRIQLTATDAFGASTSSAFDLKVEAPHGIYSIGRGTLVGTQYDDTLLAYGYGAQLIGGAGNDTLAPYGGFYGSPSGYYYTFNGGLGDDQLTGTYATDRYIFALGDGHDTITDDVRSNYEGQQWLQYRPDVPWFNDRLIFGAGISLQNLSASRVGDDMFLRIAGGADSITIKNWFDGTILSKIEEFYFADGSMLSAYALEQMLVSNNSAPVLTSPIDAQQANEDGTWSFSVPLATFSDADGDQLVYSATLADGAALPGWLSFDAATGTFSGTPTNDQVGNISLAVTATDPRGLAANANFALTINNINDAPVVSTGLTNQSASQGAAWAYTVPANTFTDVDAGDTITLSATLANGNALPAWLSFNAATGTFSGRPLGANVGDLALKVTATDTAGAAVSTVLNLNVISTNHAPVASGLLDQQAIETQTFSYKLPASTFTDVDLGDSLTMQVKLAGGAALPAWLTFNAATQTLSGTPPDTASGLLAITVTATDEQGATASSSFSLDIANIVNGTALDDVLLGTVANDVIYGGLGADRMTGGKGNDVYYVDNALDKVIEKANEGRDTVRATVTLTLAANVEDLVLDGVAAIDGTGNVLDNRIEGNAADNKLMGGDGSDTLLGGAGDDWLRGGTGSDTLVGGTGDDLYEVDNTGDVVVEGLNEGADTVEASVTYSLSTNVENLILTGALAIDGTGNALDNTLQGNDAANVLTGGAGNDTLNGKKGFDTLIGGLGNDTYLLEDDVDTIIELAGEGRDAVMSQLAFTLAANVEDGMLLGSAANITGNDLANVLTGNNATNTLDGGAGADVMLGGKGNDIYIVDSQADTVIENAGEGIDTVQASVNYTLADNLENLTLTGTAEAGMAESGMGNSLHNKITGNAASNKLFGGAGNDEIDGGAGADILFGGLGNDKYWVDSASDLVVEAIGEGTDTVYASVSYALADNVENLVLTGNANINAVGNAGNNRLEGNAGNNILFGGLGNDTYVFGRGSGHDVVANFDAGKPSGDMVQLGAGIVDADLNYVRAGNDLVLSINGTSDQLTIASYFENAGKGANALEKIRFADGTSLNHAAVLSRSTVGTGASAVSDAQALPAGVRTGNPTALFDAPTPAATKASDASITPQSVAESISAARERFEQGLKNLKLGTDEQGSLSRSEFAERRALPLLWNLQDALLNLQLAKNADGRFTADVSIDSRATRDLGLGISLLGAAAGRNGRLDQVARPAEVQQFDLAQLH